MEIVRQEKVSFCQKGAKNVSVLETLELVGGRAKINPDSIPTIMLFQSLGSFDVNEVLSLAMNENRELVVMGYRSPAYTDDDLWLREASKFRTDTSLVLTFEKFPNAADPSCLDPLIIVRRDFFVEVGGKIQARTMGELATSLAKAALARNKKVSYV